MAESKISQSGSRIFERVVRESSGVGAPGQVFDLTSSSSFGARILTSLASSGDNSGRSAFGSILRPIEVAIASRLLERLQWKEIMNLDGDQDCEALDCSRKDTQSWVKR